MFSDAWEDRQYRSTDSEDASFKADESGPEIKKVVFQPLEETEPVAAKRGIAHEFYGVNLNLSAELGKVTIKVRDLINLEEGSVVKLNRVADEKVMILVNENPFAHGEIVVINDRFGVRVTSLVSEDDDRDDKGNPGKES